MASCTLHPLSSPALYFTVGSVMEGAAHIRLVDLNAATVDETWPLLLAAVEGAHFIAVDLVSPTHSIPTQCPVLIMCVCVCVCVGAEWTGTTSHQASSVSTIMYPPPPPLIIIPM